MLFVCLAQWSPLKLERTNQLLLICLLGTDSRARRAPCKAVRCQISKKCSNLKRMRLTSCRSKVSILNSKVLIRVLRVSNRSHAVILKTEVWEEWIGSHPHKLFNNRKLNSWTQRISNCRFCNNRIMPKGDSEWISKISILLATDSLISKIRKNQHVTWVYKKLDRTCLEPTLRTQRLRKVNRKVRDNLSICLGLRQVPNVPLRWAVSLDQIPCRILFSRKASAKLKVSWAIHTVQSLLAATQVCPALQLELLLPRVCGVRNQRSKHLALGQAVMARLQMELTCRLEVLVNLCTLTEPRINFKQLNSATTDN